MSYIDELNNLKQQLNNGDINLKEFKTEKAKLLTQTRKTSKEKEENSPKGILELYLSTFKKIFTIKGRASRAELWLFIIMNLTISLIFTNINILINGLESILQNQNSLFILIVHAIVFITNITLMIRRFHDFGKSALYLFLPLIIILVSTLLIPFVGIFPLSIGVIMAFIWSIFLCFRGSTPHENVYGPVPQVKKRVTVFNWIVALLGIPTMLVVAIIQIIPYAIPFSQEAFFKQPTQITSNKKEIIQQLKPYAQPMSQMLQPVSTLPVEATVSETPSNTEPLGAEAVEAQTSAETSLTETLPQIPADTPVETQTPAETSLTETLPQIPADTPVEATVSETPDNTEPLGAEAVETPAEPSADTPVETQTPTLLK